MAGLIQLIFYVLYIAIIARVILSWIIPMMGVRPHPLLLSIHNAVYQITEPILAPIRRVVPSLGMIDLSPMIALILLGLIQSLIFRAL